MAAGKHKRKLCILCHKRVPIYALQSYHSNNGKPVTAKTVQVHTRPILCGICEMELTPSIIFNSYTALRDFLVEHSTDEKPPHVLYRSQKHA